MTAAMPTLLTVEEMAPLPLSALAEGDEAAPEAELALEDAEEAAELALEEADDAAELAADEAELTTDETDEGAPAAVVLTAAVSEAPELAEAEALRHEVSLPSPILTVAEYCWAPVESLIPALISVPTGRSTFQVSEVASVWSNCL